MKTNWTEKEKLKLCEKLEFILGADLDDDEMEAIFDAISIICPAYAETMEQELSDSVAEAEKILADIKKNPPKSEPLPQNVVDIRKKRGEKP